MVPELQNLSFGGLRLKQKLKFSLCVFISFTFLIECRYFVSVASNRSLRKNTGVLNLHSQKIYYKLYSHIENPFGSSIKQYNQIAFI